MMVEDYQQIEDPQIIYVPASEAYPKLPYSK